MLTDIRRTSTPDTLEAIDPNVYPNFIITYTQVGINILNRIGGGSYESLSEAGCVWYYCHLRLRVKA